MASEAPEVPEEHVRIHNHCGACGQLFLHHIFDSKIITLYYRNSSLVIRRAGWFSGREYDSERSWERTIGRTPSFCKVLACSRCRNGEESITLHVDCFHLFKQQCAVGKADDGPEQRKEIYRRLWLLGTRRYAWKQMLLPLDLPSSTTLERPPPELISKICGFQNTFLPEVPEAAQLVQRFSQSHVLWRLCTVLQLVRELESAENKEAVSYPLPEVLSWSRGKSPKLVQDESLAGAFIRFTIDARGIKSIERISDPPQRPAAGIPSPSRVFLVQSVEKLSTCRIEFELGMSRLHLPAPLSEHFSEICIWSTPTLPRPFSTSLGEYHRAASISLDLNHCTGISFFMLRHEVLEIHGHSTQYPPTHLERFQYLNSIHAKYVTEVVWIYLPLTVQDKITAVGAMSSLEEPFYLTLHTETGKIVIGTPYMKKPPAWLTLHELEQDSCRHLNLIYFFKHDGFLTLIQADGDKKIVTMDADRPATIQSLPQAFYSSASLEGILNVDVFTNEYKSICRGILIEYEDGSKRALGQCRLGLDTVQSWHKPLSFFYVATAYERNVPSLVREYEESRCVKVAFDSESSHISEDGSLEANYYEMKGYINFWFTQHDTELRIVDF